MPEILLESVYSAAKTCVVFQAAFRFPDLFHETKIAAFVSESAQSLRYALHFIYPAGTMKRSIQAIGSLIGDA